MMGASASEVWLPIGGFAGIYEVSSLGRVKSLPRRIRMAHNATRQHAGGIMTPVIDRNGYRRVVLRVDGKHYTRKVARLVCEAFNGPQPSGTECAHLDGSRDNNTPDNLAWVTHGDNIRHQVKHGTFVGTRNLIPGPKPRRAVQMEGAQ